MTMTPPFDTLRLSRALQQKSRFTAEQAEEITDAFVEAFEDSLATKDDIASLRTELALMEQRLTNKLGLLAAAIVGVLAAMKLL